MDTSSLLLRECENKMCFGVVYPDLLPVTSDKFGNSSSYECKLCHPDSIGSGLVQCSLRSCACLCCCPFHVVMSGVDCYQGRDGLHRIQNINEWSFTTLCCCLCGFCSA